MQEPHHVAKVSKATQWKPGVSGNPAGKTHCHQICIQPGFYPRFRARLTGRGIGSCWQGCAQELRELCCDCCESLPADVRISSRQPRFSIMRASIRHIVAATRSDTSSIAEAELPLRNREVVSIPDRTSRTGAGKRKAPAASNRSAAHKVARRIAGRRSVAVLLRALLRAAS